MSLLLRDVTLPDGARADVHVAAGTVRAIARPGTAVPPDGTIVAADGAWVLPGLVDIVAAQSAGPTLARELRAAGRAGVTTLLLAPRPAVPLDEVADVRDLLQHVAAIAGAPHVRAIGALTIGLAGEGIADMAGLREAGCVAVCNGPTWVRNSLVARCAMRYAGDLGLPLLIRPVDPWLSGGGCAHAGRVATRLGLAGIPVVAETAALARDLLLVEETGARAHFGPISSAAGAAMIRASQERGVPVTADTTIQHLFHTENDLLGYDPCCHVQPPLRSQDDREALRAAVAEGWLGVRSDHRPLTSDAKTAPFPATEPGVATLPTLLALALRLVDEGLLDVPGLVHAFASGPAAALGLATGSLTVGATADLVVVDPDHVWRIDPTDPAWPSSGRNTPFRGWEVRGRVLGRVVGGRWLAEDVVSAPA